MNWPNSRTHLLFRCKGSSGHIQTVWQRILMQQVTGYAFDKDDKAIDKAHARALQLAEFGEIPSRKFKLRPASA